MRKKNFGLFLFIFLISTTASAQLTYFDCSGESQNIKGGSIERERFDMSASVNPAQIIAPAGILGCLSLSKENKITYSCQVNDSQIICECKGGDYATGKAYLSRTSGQLTIISTRQTRLIVGEYSCKKINKKIL
jgi:hypothetical protein